MPTYQYRCKACDTRFDWIQPMADDPLTSCPAEGGPSACTAPGQGEVNKVFGAVGVTFKGSGFYKTDSRPEPSKTAAAANGSSPTSGDTNGSDSSSSSTTTQNDSKGDAKKGDAKSKASSGTTSGSSSTSD